MFLTPRADGRKRGPWAHRAPRLEQVASILHPRHTIHAPAASVAEWDRIQAVNVRGVFLCYKAAAVQMIRQGRGGRIIGP